MPRQAELQSLFAAMDGNNDGVVSAAEFRRAMTGKRKKELRALLNAERVGWKTVLKNIDADHNGEVSFQEFVNAVDGVTHDAPRAGPGKKHMSPEDLKQAIKSAEKDLEEAIRERMEWSGTNTCSEAAWIKTCEEELARLRRLERTLSR